MLRTGNSAKILLGKDSQSSKFMKLMFIPNFQILGGGGGNRDIV